MNLQDSEALITGGAGLIEWTGMAGPGARQSELKV